MLFQSCLYYRLIKICIQDKILHIFYTLKLYFKAKITGAESIFLCVLHPAIGIVIDIF